MKTEASKFMLRGRVPISLAQPYTGPDQKRSQLEPVHTSLRELTVGIYLLAIPHTSRWLEIGRG